MSQQGPQARSCPFLSPSMAQTANGRDLYILAVVPGKHRKPWGQGVSVEMAPCVLDIQAFRPKSRGLTRELLLTLTRLPLGPIQASIPPQDARIRGGFPLGPSP